MLTCGGDMMRKKRVNIMLDEHSINLLNDLTMYTLYSRSSIIGSLLHLINDTMTPEQIKQGIEKYHIDGRRK